MTQYTKEILFLLHFPHTKMLQLQKIGLVIHY